MNNHELLDVDAETQRQAFDYLFRKSSDSKAPDRDWETQTDEFDYLILERKKISSSRWSFSRQMKR